MENKQLRLTLAVMLSISTTLIYSQEAGVKCLGNGLPAVDFVIVIVGYDHGLLLYSLVRIGDPLQHEIYSKMMDVLDDTGAWVEYYQDGKPRGTRYRPCESGINLEAALSYAETYR